MNNQAQLGSSETTREASTHHPFLPYIPYLPQHRRFNQKFLEWFIGFAEGEGNFQFWSKNQDNSFWFALRITHVDHVLLSTLRTELGYGTITTITANDGLEYPQLCLQTRQTVIAMLHLFTGNIRLQKVQRSFDEWSTKVCQQFQIPIPHNPHGLGNQPVTLTDAWFSGFFQADGGFAAHYRLDSRRSQGYRVELKAFVDQQGELEILEAIALLFGGTVYCRDREQEYYRAHIGTLAGLTVFIKYLTRFPLRGRKHIAQNRWIRVLKYMNTYELPEPETKRYNRFVRLVRHVHFCQKQVKSR